MCIKRALHLQKLVKVSTKTFDVLAGGTNQVTLGDGGANVEIGHLA